ncbi:MAG TPA: TrkA family potassium uptake protein [Dermatophilaceae bacterium]|nr:TrkA family potassium uptake protein [Dermatophilaceae bacterium]
MARTQRSVAKSVLIIGLGRFGSAVATTLMQMGKEVLAVDENADLVQRWSSELTHVVQADTTDEEALRQLGAAGYDRAVVAIGNDIEASVLTVLALVEAGVTEIWAKAITAKHAKILTSIGAHHVVLPEATMGQRMAHMLVGSMDDYFEFEAGYAMARLKAPAVMWGVPLGTSQVRTRYQITVVGVKRPGGVFTYAENTTVIQERDEVIVSGAVRHVERFAGLPQTRQGGLT